MSREEFLDRVRQAARAGAAHRIHPQGDVNERTGHFAVEGDLCERMAAEVDAVGGKAHLVDRLNDARNVLAALIDEYAARSAYCWRHVLLDRLRLAELLASKHVSRIDHRSLESLDPAARQDAILAADIGITSADWAVAETGTLAVFSRPGQERLASLAPAVHVAIIERRQILPDLFDLFAKLDAAGGDALPSNLTLITGPSKTGDIELQLTTGVHGPGQWHVIIARADA
jgi:L-lactate utilization protein LutC